MMVHSFNDDFRKPNEVITTNRLPVVGPLSNKITTTYEYSSILEYYDRFKMPFSEYASANWVPAKEQYPLNFGVHYPCYKNDRATYECLLKFRTFYPYVPIVLISDNGHDFTAIATYFNCQYIHETEQNGNGVTNILEDGNKISIWLQRIKRTCELLKNVDYILYMEDDLLTRDVITKNPNADLAGPSNPDDFWWSPQIVQWMGENRPNVEINGLNGCGGSIFNRTSFIECVDNQPDYKEMGKLDDRLTWASDVILTFLFMYNKKVSRRWLDHSEESRGKIFGSTAFDHQFKYFYGKKWSPYYLANTHLDKATDFIFTACSDNIFSDQYIPFIGSLKDNTSFNGTVVIIDYGLSEANLQKLIDHNIRVIPSVGLYEIVSDRFISIERYISYLNDPNKVFAHFDCDIWFVKDLNNIFDLCREHDKAHCTKDVWHCGFLHDCVAKEDHKEYNRNILFEVEARCGKVLQAGFICGNTSFWKTFSGYLSKLLTGGYLKNVFGADELALNLMYYYMEDQFTIMPCGYNTLPQWGIKDIDGKLIATDFHTDSKLVHLLDWTEEVLAVHLSSAARNKAEFAHTDFKVRHKDRYDWYLKDYGINGIPSKSVTIAKLGFRNSFPQLLKETNSKIICEIGVQHGGNLFHMLNGSGVTEAWGIDLWMNSGNKSENDIGLNQKEQDELFKLVSAQAANYANVNIVRNYSHVACEQFAAGYFDFVYIDADHTYAGCLRDLEAWWPKVKSGGIFAGDDYVDAISTIGVPFGVITAVTEFVAKYSLSPRFSHTWGKDNKGSSPQWFIIKE